MHSLLHFWPRSAIARASNSCQPYILRIVHNIKERKYGHKQERRNVEECSICRGKEYRKIVHTFDAYRAPIVWANESIQPIREPIVGLLIVG